MQKEIYRIQNVQLFRYGKKIANNSDVKTKIKIKKQNKGKFTDYCGGTVTDACIQKGKNSSDPTIRKRAVFAQNVRRWNNGK